VAGWLKILIGTLVAVGTAAVGFLAPGSAGPLLFAVFGGGIANFIDDVYLDGKSPNTPGSTPPNLDLTLAADVMQRTAANTFLNAFSF